MKGYLQAKIILFLTLMLKKSTRLRVKDVNRKLVP